MAINQSKKSSATKSSPEPKKTSPSKPKPSVVKKKIPTDDDVIKLMTYDPSTISMRGCKTHNLQDITVTIPKNKLITVTGVS
jgi:hypothetical protein